MGTKNLSAELHLFNSASQIRVIKRGEYRYSRRLSTGFSLISLFPANAQEQPKNISPKIFRKSFFAFFLTVVF